VGGVGAVVFALTLLGAYLRGEVTILQSVGTVAGSVLLSMALPPVGHALYSRVVAACILVVAAQMWDPAKSAAQAGRRVWFEKASPAERTALVKSAYRDGRYDFSNLDLSGADFTGANLYSITFDGCNLSNANFHNADVSEMSLGNANITGATFTGALMAMVGVGEAEGWRGISCDDRTVMPVQWSCVDGKPELSNSDEDADADADADGQGDGQGAPL